MKKHISFPSIEQYRNIISNINRTHTFVGLDEQGEAIYNSELNKPTIEFTGTIKLHGTNAAVCYNKFDGLWAQSRENIITVEKDNAGFALFVEKNKHDFTWLMSNIVKKYNIEWENGATISIYGEWCGAGIQKGIAISQLDKSFFIFGIKITPSNDNEVSYWVDHSGFNRNEGRIFNILDYQTYKINIDFNKPQAYQNQLIEHTIEVETQCPVGSAFGYEGIGEGIVWSANYKDSVIRFKVKGEKHSKSKVKVLNPVDDVKLNKIEEIVQKVTPEWRLQQMLEQSCDLLNGGQLDRNKLGDYIRLVISDVVKEELDVMVEAGLELKDINKSISEVARKYFFEQEKVKI